MINKEELLQKIPKLLDELKNKNPLTHCITNFVTVNDCANAVLAIGASPIMSGKLSHEQVEGMKVSSAQANKINTPVILDPVGVGISQLRNKVTLELIENYKLTAIRGNITEIKTIAKLTGIISESNTAKGVDVSESDIITKDNLNENAKIISKLAANLDTVILASGPIDILSDGETTIAIDNGDEMMPQITGSGCMLSSIVGSCIGATNPLEGTLLAALLMTIAGEKARAKVDNENAGTGSFRAYLIDYLYKLDSQTLINKSNIEIL